MFYIDKLSVEFIKETENYRSKFYAALYEKYVKSEEENDIIDLCTLKVVKRSSAKKNYVKEFGTLAHYNCESGRRILHLLKKKITVYKKCGKEISLTGCEYELSVKKNHSVSNEEVELLSPVTKNQPTIQNEKNHSVPLDSLSFVRPASGKKIKHSLPDEVHKVSNMYSIKDCCVKLHRMNISCGSKLSSSAKTIQSVPSDGNKQILLMNDMPQAYKAKLSSLKKAVHRVSNTYNIKDYYTKLLKLSETEINQKTVCVDKSTKNPESSERGKNLNLEITRVLQSKSKPYINCTFSCENPINANSNEFGNFCKKYENKPKNLYPENLNSETAKALQSNSNPFINDAFNFENLVNANSNEFGSFCTKYENNENDLCPSIKSTRFTIKEFTVSSHVSVLKYDSCLPFCFSKPLQKKYPRKTILSEEIYKYINAQPSKLLKHCDNSFKTFSCPISRVVQEKFEKEKARFKARHRLEKKKFHSLL